MSLLKPRTPSSLLGLALEGHQLEGVVLRRTNGSMAVHRSFEASLALDLLTNDPELVGRELRNHLNQAGVRERHCVVGLPLDWALTLHTSTPDLSEPDVQGYLNVQAERGFPYALEDLAIGCSRYQLPNGERHATLVAIPRNHLALLQRALEAAQLKPASFSLGITALQNTKRASNRGALVVALGRTGVGLQALTDGGVAALRSLQGAVEVTGPDRRVDTDLLAREIRITLGQLPAEARESISCLRVFGRAEWTQAVVPELAASVKPMGLEAELGTLRQAPGLSGLDPAHEGCAFPIALAARHMAGQPPVFEFLPPRVSAWTELTSRFASRRVVWVGAAATAAAVLVGGAFAWQYSQLASLQSRWKVMSPRVTEVEDLQQQVRRFRPWFDDSHRSLTMLKKLTEAFPEDGAVTAKNLEIRELANVTCSGVARESQDLFRVLDRLRETRQVQNVQTPVLNGKGPVQFTFGFRWIEGGAL